MLAAAIAFPVSAFAAKDEGKKKKAQTPEESFATFDSNKDGVVTQAEYFAVMKSLLGEATAKARFAEMDKNSDGKLTKEEFADVSVEPKKKRKK